MNKLIVKAFFYRFVFLLSYIIFVGVSMFFHFALGHEISEIENWLFYYSGVALIFLVCSRFFIIFLTNGESSNGFNSLKNEVIKQIQSFKLEYFLSILVISVFLLIYFNSTYFDVKQVGRAQLIPRYLSLFFVITIDILASSYYLLRLPREEQFFRIGFLDCLIAVVGIFLFRENLQLSLVLSSFYAGCYLLFLISKNILIVFIYWLFIIAPLSSSDLIRVDFFSSDYQNLFSTFVVLVAHLIPYIWLESLKRGKRGRKSIGHITPSS